jgi:uncharacterized protein (DUF2235 family)
MTTSNNKKLVVFFDGTWNSADQHSKDGKLCPTNVAKLFIATLTHDLLQNEQIIHYVKGVGTKKLERISGGGFGYGISDNIKDGYQFLVSNYEDGDDIYIFGFSRGAFTARSLAGLIYNVGILTRDKLYLIDKAYDIYKDKSQDWHPDSPNSLAFKEEHTWSNERIKFLGVFDTVGALGAPFGIILGWLVDKLFGCSFHDTKLSSIIENAYHALAIDERRLVFQATLMTPNALHNNDEHFAQQWFPGVHSNIGGGYPNTGLSDLALKWMADKAQQHGLNLDLGKISIPKFAPDIKEVPNNSQTLFYRISSVLFVKLPGYFGLVPESYKHTLPDIQWNGDYIRPIANRANVAEFLGNPPKNSDLRRYQGDLDSCVIEKINQCAGEYQPVNVVGREPDL